MRIDLDLIQIANKLKHDEVGPFLKSELNDVRKEHNLDWKIDEELLFYAHHFGPYNGWAMYDNGRPKKGTLRYRSGLIRIPNRVILPVYETKEFEEKKPSRGLIRIPSMIICNLNELTEEELMDDGFTSHEHAVEDMKRYPPYKDIHLESVVSYYKFGDWV